MKRYDLMHQINARGTFLTSKGCIPHLKRAANPHVLMLSPPLDMKAKWFAPHIAYTMAKFGMSMCVLGMADEFAARASPSMRCGRAPASPRRRSRTCSAATRACAQRASRRSWPTRPTRSSTSRRASFTGNFLIDDTFLSEDGVTDFDQYRVDPTQPLTPDFFVPDNIPVPKGVKIEAGFH